MSSSRPWHWPDTSLVSALAALTTWVTLLSWAPFAERPSDYLVPLLGLAVLVAVSGTLLRAARLPAVLVVLVQALVIAALLHHAWSRGQAVAGWIPTGDSVRAMGHTISASVHASQSYAAPVPESVSAFAPLMVLAGSGTLVLVDFLACGLRRVPLAGLPLLAVYTVPVSVAGAGVSWVKFAVDAILFLLLLAAQEAGRLARWGHGMGGSRLFDSQETPVTTEAVWASARKIGITATGLAVVVPLALPSFGGTLLQGHGNGPGGSGGEVDLANPMVHMKRDLVRGSNEPLVTVDTTAPEPSYLRLTVLDEYDGREWRPSPRKIPLSNRVEGRLPRPPGLNAGVSTHREHYRITISDAFRSRWLPAPYPDYSIQAPGDWRYDKRTLDFVSAASGQSTAGISYQVTGLAVTPTDTELADAPPAPGSVFRPMTRVPRSVPPSVGRLAHQVTAGAHNDYDKAVLLQSWFRDRGGFTYSTDTAPGDGVEALTKFLGTGPGSRTGYCQQFATAMALMGRILGIPSRVAVGFLRPKRTGPHTYVFSLHDLHAWPEMYFQGVGWRLFDPTPAVRTGAAPPHTRNLVSAPSHQPTPAPATTAPTQNRITHPAQFKGPANGGGSSGGGGGLPLAPFVAVLVALAVAALLSAPRVARAGVRHRRWSRAASPAELVEAAWAELRDVAVDHGVAWDDTVTVRTRARDLARSFGADGEQDALGRGPVRGAAANPEATRAIDRLVESLERARYARSMPPDFPVDSVRTDTDTCVHALAAGATASARLRARWLPGSLWSRRRPSTGRPAELGPLTTAGVDHAV